MARFVAFLRGMNLGGRRLGNAELCAAVEQLGFAAPAAFLASGNLVFEASGSAQRVRERLERGLPEQLGYPVPTFVRSARQVRAVAASEPFQGRRGSATRGKLQVAFLQQAPGGPARKAALALATDADWLAIDGTELYWSPSGGLSDSALDIKALEAALGRTTIRTKNTVQRLAAKFLREGRRPR